jgi:hypothetical protein
MPRARRAGPCLARLLGKAVSRPARLSTATVPANRRAWRVTTEGQASGRARARYPSSLERRRMLTGASTCNGTPEMLACDETSARHADRIALVLRPRHAHLADDDGSLQCAEGATRFRTTPCATQTETRVCYRRRPPDPGDCDASATGSACQSATRLRLDRARSRRTPADDVARVATNPARNERDLQVRPGLSVHPEPVETVGIEPTSATAQRTASTSVAGALVSPLARQRRRGCGGPASKDVPRAAEAHRSE